MTSPATLDRLVAERDTARRASDWRRADALRREIEAYTYDCGPFRWRVALMDGPDGTQWHWTMTTPPVPPQSGQSLER